MSVKYKIIKRANPQSLTAPKKFYATAVHEKTINLKELAREAAARSTTVSEGDAYAVIILFRDLIREHLSDSNVVKVDGIGSFTISTPSEGSDTEEKFHQGLIKGAKLLYKPDVEMKDFLKTAKFEKYVSRA